MAAAGGSAGTAGHSGDLSSAVDSGFNGSDSCFGGAGVSDLGDSPMPNSRAHRPPAFGGVGSGSLLDMTDLAFQQIDLGCGRTGGHSLSASGYRNECNI